MELNKSKVNYYVLAHDLGSENNMLSVSNKSWLLDTGSTVHVTNDLDDLINVENTDLQVKTGINMTSQATKMGEAHLIDPVNSGKLKLKKVMYIPNFSKKSISGGSLLNNHTQLIAQDDMCYLRHSKNGAEISLPKNLDNNMFYITPKEQVNNMEEEEQEEFNNKKDPIMRIDINTFHDVMWHIKKRAFKRLTQSIGVVLTSNIKPCTSCCKAKAMAKVVKHHTKTKANKPGERIFVDISGPLPFTPMGNKYWVQIVDDYTSYGYLGFIKEKSDVPDIVEKYADFLKKNDHTPKYMRMDNSGENTKQLSESCKENNRNSQYQTHLSKMVEFERRIAVLRQMSQEALTSAKLNETGRKLLVTECLNTMNTLYNLTPHPKKESISYTSMMGKPSQLYPCIVEFGRTCYVTKQEKSR